jgi:hypothetical protein
MNGKLESSILNKFMQRLIMTAQNLMATDNRSYNIESKPEFVGLAFNCGATAVTMLSVSELPEECLGLTISHFPLILGVLPDSPIKEAVQESVRRYRNQCVVAKSYLSPSQSLDLQLMLLGPRGSDTDSNWDSLAKLVERDDRVARKLIWLMPENPERDLESFNQFIKQTFLARPWRGTSKFGDVELDKLSDAEAKGDGLPRGTVTAFEKIALDEEKTPDEIVDALVKAWKTRNKI